MNQRGRDLSVVMGGQLAWVGPGVRLLSVSELMQWMTIRMEVIDDARLLEIADDFDLRQATLERRGRAWFRQVTSKEGKVIMIAAGPRHTGPVPERSPS